MFWGLTLVHLTSGCATTMRAHAPSQIVSKEYAVLQANQLISNSWPDVEQPTPIDVSETDESFVIQYPPLFWTEIGSNVVTVVEIHKTEARVHVHPK